MESGLNNDYIFSYTAATLMLHETNEVMKKYLEYKNWDNVKHQLIELYGERVLKYYFNT